MSKTDEVSEIEANGVFIYVGLDPLTEPFKKAGITNEAGWIETDQEMRTKIPGVYAIGDVREKTLRQITTAVGEGGIAGQQVFNYIEELKIKNAFAFNNKGKSIFLIGSFNDKIRATNGSELIFDFFDEQI